MTTKAKAVKGGHQEMLNRAIDKAMGDEWSGKDQRIRAEVVFRQRLGRLLDELAPDIEVWYLKLVLEGKYT